MHFSRFIICISPSLPSVFLSFYHLYFSWFIICISLGLSYVFLLVYHLYFFRFITCISLSLSYMHFSQFIICFLSFYHLYFSWFIICISLGLSSVFLLVYHQYFSSLSPESHPMGGCDRGHCGGRVIFQVVAEVHFSRQETNVPTTLGNRWRCKWENEPHPCKIYPLFCSEPQRCVIITLECLKRNLKIWKYSS